MTMVYGKEEFLGPSEVDVLGLVGVSTPSDSARFGGLELPSATALAAACAFFLSSLSFRLRSASSDIALLGLEPSFAVLVSVYASWDFIESSCSADHFWSCAIVGCLYARGSSMKTAAPKPNESTIGKWLWIDRQHTDIDEKRSFLWHEHERYSEEDILL
jgi:hypothetical protein